MLAFGFAKDQMTQVIHWIEFTYLSQNPGILFLYEEPNF
jgi:hypothetical protein